MKANEIAPFVPMPGKVLNERYRLIEHLAEGGMGEIWVAELIEESLVQGSQLANRDSSLKKIVAIKFVRGVSGNSLQHFRREREISLLLEDASVMYSIGQGSVQGVHYMVMQYINGVTIKALVPYFYDAANFMDQDKRAKIAVHIFSEILFGLMYLHNLHDPSGHPLGIVHRDLSPANVIVSTTGSVRILDFGISKADGYEFPELSEKASIKGTIRYMAPERLHDEPATPKSDLYAAGAILYELLSGRTFRGNVQGAQLLMMVAENRYPTLPLWVEPEIITLYGRLMNRQIESARDVARYLERLEIPTMRLALSQAVNQLMGTPNVTTGYTPFDLRQTWALPGQASSDEPDGSSSKKEKAKPPPQVPPLTQTVNLEATGVSDESTKETRMNYADPAVPRQVQQAPTGSYSQFTVAPPTGSFPQMPVVPPTGSYSQFTVAPPTGSFPQTPVAPVTGQFPQTPVAMPTKNASPPSSFSKRSALLAVLFVVILPSLGAVVVFALMAR